VEFRSTKSYSKAAVEVSERLSAGLSREEDVEKTVRPDARPKNVWTDGIIDVQCGDVAQRVVPHRVVDAARSCMRGCYNAWNIVHPAWPGAEYFIKQLEVD
jgi:hypothetical protein